MTDNKADNILKIIVAPDSFKGSIDAGSAARAIARGARSALPHAEVIELPIADGGEGTLDVLTLPSERVSVKVSRTDGLAINAEYGVVGRRAIIEMSRAAGLETVPVAERDPEYSTTKGVGQLILSALDNGCREIILTVGGSGSNDGGIGMLEALGARFYSGKDQITDIRAKDLSRLTDIDIDGIDPRLKKVAITLACDVNNPLCGDNGATHVYGRQKGADDAMLERLESGMRNWSAVLSRIVADASSVPGTGAGGGISFPLVALFGAKLCSGIETVLEVIDFDKKLDGAALVITGEGKIDRQSACGKAISGVASAAKRRGIPVLALVGAVGDGAAEMSEVGVSEIRALSELTDDFSYSLSHADELLESLTAKVLNEKKTQYDQ